MFCSLVLPCSFSYYWHQMYSYLIIVHHKGWRNIVNFYKVSNPIIHVSPLFFTINWKFAYYYCSHSKTPLHVLLQELKNPFSCDLETIRGINYDFKSKGFYHASHYGLNGGSSKGLSCLSHFLQCIHQNILKF